MDRVGQLVESNNAVGSATTGATVRMPTVFSETNLGSIYFGDSLALLSDQVVSESVDAIITSPPFALVRKKDYGNVAADQYVDWFRPFAAQFHRILKEAGSLVIDIGGSWNPGEPTRSLYHYELLLMLCKEFEFRLAQEFYWWNPAKLPTPAEWVTVRRIRVKDAVNCVWWLSKSPWPKASNRRVLSPYSDSMKSLLKNGYEPKLRPSGHDISDKFSRDNGAAIPPNLIAVANTDSNSSYLKYCEENDLKPHPARFPSELPEFFVRMLTDEGDLVVDPFAGSCVVGEVCERLGRRWICGELVEDYLKGALGRFVDRSSHIGNMNLSRSPPRSYKVFHPGANWTSSTAGRLSRDGGRKRQPKRRKDVSTGNGRSGTENNRRHSNEGWHQAGLG